MRNLGENINYDESQSPSPQQPQKVQPVQSNARYGKTTKAITDSKTKYPVRYKVVEANELNTLHKIDGTGVLPRVCWQNRTNKKT